jgi:DNA-binding response OmpR family regulator
MRYANHVRRSKRLLECPTKAYSIYHTVPANVRAIKQLAKEYRKAVHRNISVRLHSVRIQLTSGSRQAPRDVTVLEAMQKVLVIDDDAALRDIIGLMLETEGFHPALAEDGKAGIKQALIMKPDLVLVDLRMPGLSGFEVCKQIRAAGMMTPLIVLSAIGDEIDKVLLLEIGADDYVVKPFGTRELLARIRALLRRSSTEGSKVVAFGDVEVDPTRRLVKKKGKEINFTRAEYNLLTYFLQNPNRTLTRDVILNSMRGYESFPNSRTVDVHVLHLRQKLERDAASPQHLLTVYGVGYRFLA